MEIVHTRARWLICFYFSKIALYMIYNDEIRHSLSLCMCVLLLKRPDAYGRMCAVLTISAGLRYTPIAKWAYAVHSCLCMSILILLLFYLCDVVFGLRFEINDAIYNGYCAVLILVLIFWWSEMQRLCWRTCIVYYKI